MSCDPATFSACAFLLSYVEVVTGFLFKIAAFRGASISEYHVVLAKLRDRGPSKAQHMMGSAVTGNIYRAEKEASILFRNKRYIILDPNRGQKFGWSQALDAKFD
ncbi:MAG: hypothetical protein QOH39_2701 [Verrucomicrobiota bacterium]|jgi:hypothetical protein